MSLQNFRAGFAQGASTLVHLNNAGLAPSSRVGGDQVRYWMQRFESEGMHCNDDYMAAIEKARGQLALLAGAKPHQIAFFQSTAGAISQVAFGMSLNASDEVLVWDQEYASNLYPWKVACDRSGAKLVRATSEADGSTPIENLLAKVTARTKVIAVSWIQFQTGAEMDVKKLAEFAKPRGIFTLIDIIQGFGIMPFDFTELGIDAACGGSHKWLVSPVGVGFLMLRSERLPQIKPINIGAMTYGTCDDPSDLSCPPKTDSTKFEAGSKQVLEITALGANCQWLSACGVETLRDEAFRLAEKLRQALLDLGWNLHQPQVGNRAFVNFSHKKNSPQQVAHVLKKNRISYALRGPGIRLSPHAFNVDADIERAIEALAAV